MVLWLAAAHAGYGDAGAGFPTPEARQLHIWVNATRVQPDAFEPEYLAGGCSYYTDFSASEQTPKIPYRYDAGLAEAAHVHTLDMIATGVLQHDSSDGTPWYDRIGQYYPGGTLAENIAWSAWGTARDAVQSNWMCSAAGHRGALMSSVYDDFGGAFGGSTGDWYATADMGLGNNPAPPVRMGAHEPTTPGLAVQFLGDWTDSAPPDSYDVVVDGDAVPLALTWGVADSGVYTAQVPVPRGTCHPYFFSAVQGGVETRFPEDGAYSFGSCAGADPDTGWLPVQVGPLGYTSGPWTPGTAVTLTVTGAVPGQPVRFVRGSVDQPGPCIAGMGGVCLDIRGSLGLLGTRVADATGTATLLVNVPAWLASGTVVHHQALVADGLGNWFAAPAETSVVP